MSVPPSSSRTAGHRIGYVSTTIVSGISTAIHRGEDERTIGTGLAERREGGREGGRERGVEEGGCRAGEAGSAGGGEMACTAQYRTPQYRESLVASYARSARHTLGQYRAMHQLALGQYRAWRRQIAEHYLEGRGCRRPSLVAPYARSVLDTPYAISVLDSTQRLVAPAVPDSTQRLVAKYASAVQPEIKYKQAHTCVPDTASERRAEVPGRGAKEREEQGAQESAPV
eukprot:3886501-Rhodomonas_salina.1